MEVTISNKEEEWLKVEKIDEEEFRDISPNPVDICNWIKALKMVLENLSKVKSDIGEESTHVLPIPISEKDNTYSVLISFEKLRDFFINEYDTVKEDELVIKTIGRVLEEKNPKKNSGVVNGFSLLMENQMKTKNEDPKNTKGGKRKRVSSDQQTLEEAKKIEMLHDRNVRRKNDLESEQNEDEGNNENENESKFLQQTAEGVKIKIEPKTANSNLSSQSLANFQRDKDRLEKEKEKVEKEKEKIKEEKEKIENEKEKIKKEKEHIKNEKEKIEKDKKDKKEKDKKEKKESETPANTEISKEAVVKSETETSKFIKHVCENDVNNQALFLILKFFDPIISNFPALITTRNGNPLLFYHIYFCLISESTVFLDEKENVLNLKNKVTELNPLISKMDNLKKAFVEVKNSIILSRKTELLKFTNELMEKINKFIELCKIKMEEIKNKKFIKNEHGKSNKNSQIAVGDDDNDDGDGDEKDDEKNDEKEEKNENQKQQQQQQQQQKQKQQQQQQQKQQQAPLQPPPLRASS